ncbi:MAG: protein kinase [Gammaproteobacteria bacterium]|nr:protein kinase [Gammaproteobacteria bacterium]
MMSEYKKEHTSTSKIRQLLSAYDQLRQLKNDDCILEEKIYEPQEAVIQLSNFSSVVHRARLNPNTIERFTELNSANYFNKPVAVKEMHYNLKTKIYCEKETSILAFLTNQNLNIGPMFYGYVDDPYERQYRIVMDYFPAGSLSDQIDNDYIRNWELNQQGLSLISPPSWDERRFMVRKFLQDVAQFHDQDMLHCDIKSPNVLFVKDENNHVTDVKLCDFAFAKDAGDFVTEITGTHGYISPEMSRLYFPGSWPWVKRKVDLALSEIYSISTVSREIVTWQPPTWLIHGYDFEETLRFTIHEKETLPENCPKKMAEMIQWGWDADPQKRPTVYEMLNLVEDDIEEAELEKSEPQFSP